MYSVINKMMKFKKNNKVDGYEMLNLDGFIMSSKKGFKINNQVIKDVKVVDKELASMIVSYKVKKKYKDIILILTDLITSDDDTASSQVRALDLIEKFRLEVKNRYRAYLKMNELHMMSKQLKILKKEAEKRLVELNMENLTKENMHSRGRK